jgi:excisionase family DNA binding protein
MKPMPDNPYRRETKAERATIPKLQSRKITAKQLGICDRTIDSMIRDGRLQAMKIGTRVMVKVASVEALLSA